MDEQKKISLPEIIMAVLIVGAADLFGIFAGFAVAVPVIGQALIVFSFFMSLSIWLIVQIWLIIKGVGMQQLWYGGGSVLDILTGGAIPLQSPSLWLTLFLANHPKLEAITTGAVKGAITKGGVAGAVAGAAKEAVKS